MSRKKDPDTWMWERAFELVDRADRLQRQFFQRGRPRAQRATWIPPLDVYETEDAIWLLVALPGVRPERLRISIEGRDLIIGGERRLPPECQTATIHRMEIPQGLFERSIELPPGGHEIIDHEMVDGCLVLRLRRSS